MDTERETAMLVGRLVRKIHKSLLEDRFALRAGANLDLLAEDLTDLLFIYYDDVSQFDSDYVPNSESSFASSSDMDTGSDVEDDEEEQEPSDGDWCDTSDSEYFPPK